MPNIQTKLDWEKTALEKYTHMVSRIPLFHRELAKQVVEKKAPMLAKERGSNQVEEQDIVRSFFTEVPLAFYSLMVRLMEEAKFDYKKYEPK